MDHNELSQYDQDIVSSWQEVTKRSQLTLWILLVLHRGAGDMACIKEGVEALSCGVVSADDKSMYRALRRFEDIELIESRAEKSPNGPDKKVFTLTGRGGRVLRAYIKECIEPTYLNTNVVALMKGISGEKN